MSARRAARPFALGATVLLTACFNGDPGLGAARGSDDAGPPAAQCRPPVAGGGATQTGPQRNPARNPGRFLFARQASTGSSEEFVEQANAQGALGFRFSAPFEVGGDTGALYICDTANPAVWTFRARPWVPGSVTPEALRERLDKEGDEGYRYLGQRLFSDGIHLIFVKNGSRIDRFAYRVEAASLSNAALLAQANRLGKSEFRFSERFALSTVDLIEIYRRNRVTPQQYEYTGREVAATPAAFVNQATPLGTDGYRYLADLAIGGFDSQSIYVKNTTTPGVYAVQTQPVADTTGRLLAQANDQGAAGRLRIFDGQWTAAGPQANRTVYFDLNRCNCDPLELADTQVD